MTIESGTPKLPISEDFGAAVRAVKRQLNDRDRLNQHVVANAVEALAHATADAIAKLETEQRESQKGQHTLR